MKKKQGFTLIELLAVIVILAVIALITTSMILGVIEKAKKGALEDTAYGLIDSANIYFAEGIMDESQSKTEFIFEDGKQTSENKLSYKGKVEKGSLRLFSDGESALCISDGNNSAVKNVNDKKVKVVTGRCTYNSETDEYETVGVCQDLQDELDELKRKHQEEIDRLKKEYEDQVNQLKRDHTDQIKVLEETYKDQIIDLNKRIDKLEATHQAALDQLKKDYEAQIKTLTEAYEAQIAELNRQLNVFKAGGNATAAQILAGQTAFVKGTLLTGTMKNNGAVNSTLNAGGSYTIPAGYHNGLGKVTVNTLASQTSGTATAEDVKKGKIAWVNGNKIMGTMSALQDGTFSQKVADSVEISWNGIQTKTITATYIPKKDCIFVCYAFVMLGENINNSHITMSSSNMPGTRLMGYPYPYINVGTMPAGKPITCDYTATTTTSYYNLQIFLYTNDA